MQYHDGCNGLLTLLAIVIANALTKTNKQTDRPTDETKNNTSPAVVVIYKTKRDATSGVRQLKSCLLTDQNPNTKIIFFDTTWNLYLN